MRRPEILAPAGDRDALAAALAAGADAVYFGLDDGFNARARAENFASTNLAPIVAQIHRAGARAYVTLNTLVFEPELPVGLMAGYGFRIARLLHLPLIRDLDPQSTHAEVRIPGR